MDISKAIASPELGYVEFDYTPTAWDFHFNGKFVYGKPSDLIHVTFEEQTFYLDEMRFHTPSEHKIKGEPYDGEIQLIHRNDRGEKMAISILFWEGSRLASFDLLKTKIPRKVGSRNHLVGFDLRTLLPRKKQYYRYSGSFTNPPCKEGLTWVVMRQAIQLSGHQIDQLTLAQGKNNRPTQKLGSRVPLRSR